MPSLHDLLKVLAYVGAGVLSLGLVVMAIIGLVILCALVEVTVFDRRRERKAAR